MYQDSSPLAKHEGADNTPGNLTLSPITSASTVSPYQRAPRIHLPSLLTPHQTTAACEGADSSNLPLEFAQQQRKEGESPERGLDNMQVQDADAQNVFRPMETRLNLRRTSQAQAYLNMLNGFSPNYRGNINLPRNRSANIPAEKNCSLFLLGPNPAITTHQLPRGHSERGPHLRDSHQQAGAAQVPHDLRRQGDLL